MRWFAILALSVLLALPTVTQATGTAQPQAPAGTVTQSQPIFTWSAASDATWYWVWINKDGQYHYSQWVQGTSWTPSWDMQSYPGNYEWWVDTWGPSGAGAWSSGLKFQIRPTFTWAAQNGATWYRLWIDKDGQYYYSLWLQGTSYTPWWDLPAGNYQWWVQPWGPSGYGSWSSAGSFNIASAGTATPQAPAGTVTQARPTFTWTEGSGATWYRLWIQKDGQYYYSQWQQSTSFTPWWDLATGAYQWWVQTWGPAGYGSWSSAASFTINEIIVSDGMNLLAIPAVPSSTVRYLTSATAATFAPANPVTVGTGWLWFDALASDGHRRLWRMMLGSTGSMEQMTSDPYGNSIDTTPIPSRNHSGILFLTTRSGGWSLVYTASGQQGSGYGTPVYGEPYSAVWSPASGEQFVAYAGGQSGYGWQTNLFVFNAADALGPKLTATLPWVTTGSLVLACSRLDISPDARRLLISTSDHSLYHKSLPNGDAVLIADNAEEACFSPDGHHVAYVAVPSDKTTHEVYVADIAADGTLSQIQRISYDDRDKRHPTWY